MYWVIQVLMSFYFTIPILPHLDLPSVFASSAIANKVKELIEGTVVKVKLAQKELLRRGKEEEGR
ncbi:Hypothetical predicted protein [Olea europaea subsp. europaea]|uniref:Uncharacterized protein n=1 Tax=Olea europaea subsp. europaea TaxID=158383 RepID=A0A8S0TM95_OLEEU|nr:Hypothetical predicted protein [Olea europaea subsp. europaea]